MYNRTYTATASFPLGIGWKCTKCGAINAQICKIETQTSQSKTGMRHSQSLQDNVASDARYKLDSTVKRIFLAAYLSQYTHDLNECICRKCSHREIWASVKNVGETVKFCILAALLMIIPVLMSEWPMRGCWLGVIAILLAVTFIYPRIVAKKEAKMREEFARLKVEERPVLSVDAVDLTVKMCKTFAQKDGDAAVIQKIVQQCYENAKNPWQ